MKTGCFLKYSLSEDEKKGITLLSNLSPECLERLAMWFERSDSGSIIEWADIEKLAESTERSAGDMRLAAMAGDLLLRHMIRNNDTPHDLYSDIIEAGLPNKASEALLPFLKRLADVGPSYRKMRAKFNATRSGGTLLESYSMGAMILPAFDRRLDYAKDSILQYDPKIVDYVPGAQISLGIEGHVLDVSFRVTKKKLDEFITHLLALQKELAVAEKIIQLPSN